MNEPILEDVYFSLGSNLGDRETNILSAVEKMNGAFGRVYSRISSFFRSKAQGFEGEDFVNCAVKYRLSIPPEEILVRCKRIEREMGREEQLEYDESGRRIYHNRIIDIDILLYGNHSIKSKDLIIPHPLMNERDFVMIPLREIFNN